MYEWDDIDKLESALNKPFYILKMARGTLQYTTMPNKSAQTRAKNAKAEIHKLVTEWAKQQ